MDDGRPYRGPFVGVVLLTLAWGFPGAAWSQVPETENERETGAEEATEEQDEREEVGEEETADGVPAADDRLQIYEEVEVRERADDQLGIASSASEGSTGREALAARPIQRTGEIVETVPGLIATQHSGDGKANQYFVRGVNLDHGTDFSFRVDGIPVNMPSHGHGQGYSDLNFVVPELVDRVHYHKGSASVQGGDFSAAGYATIDLVPRLDSPFAQLSFGGDGYRRLVAGASTDLGGGALTGAVELQQNDGPWERPNDHQRWNGMARYYRGDAARGWSLTAMGYDASWLSTDQIPERAVRSGLIDRYGLIDPGPRGDTSRYSLSGDVRRGDDHSLTRMTAYAVSYDLDLISNFTYFLDNPIRGDQILQRDDRWLAGIDVEHIHSARIGDDSIDWTFGAQVRYDDIENGLFRTREQVPFETVRRDQIELWTGGAWVEAAFRWSERLRTTTALRVDHYDARVASDLAVNSGSVDDQLVSPKVSIAWRGWKSTELYASHSYGFHSNDARGATIAVDPSTGEPARPVDPLVPAEGTEVGLRTSPLPGLQTTFALFSLEIDSELLFVGDGGFTEASRPSRRLGVEWTNAWRVRPWLTLDLDAAWVDAEFTDDDPAGSEIPGALESVVTGGITVHRGAWTGTLRLRAFSGYPLIEDGSRRAGSTTLVNGRVGYRVRPGWRLFLEGFNLLDREDTDIEYLYTSRLPGEPAEGVEDVHFHPIERLALRIGVEMRF
jgi:outer membrane receptor protein involved in Fe transport